MPKAYKVTKRTVFFDKKNTVRLQRGSRELRSVDH